MWEYIALPSSSELIKELTGTYSERRRKTKYRLRMIYGGHLAGTDAFKLVFRSVKKLHPTRGVEILVERALGVLKSQVNATDLVTIRSIAREAHDYL